MGQHLHFNGKELVASELATKKTEQHLAKVETNPIQMQWKEDNPYEGKVLAQNEPGDLVVSNNYENFVKSNKCQGKETEGNNKKSLRTSKMPVTKSKEFLW